jgi:hypothetical protein
MHKHHLLSQGDGTVTLIMLWKMLLTYKGDQLIQGNLLTLIIQK